MWNTDLNAAPKDRPILAICKHDADPYFLDNHRLTLYGAHCEGMSHVDDGPNVLVWGGGWDDRSFESPNEGWCPDWWFLRGSEYEVAAFPIAWCEIPPG